jgi:hypothetical protein
MNRFVFATTMLPLVEEQCSVACILKPNFVFHVRGVCVDWRDVLKEACASISQCVRVCDRAHEGERPDRAAPC